MNIKTKILNQINLDKQKAEHSSEVNLNKALQDKEFKSLYLKLKTLNFDIAKKEFEKQNVNSMKKEYKEVYAKAIKRLKDLGMTFDDFKPDYKCKLCKDTGFIDGKYCKCFYTRMNKQLTSNVGIDINFLHTFENSKFDLFDDKEKMQKVYQKIEGWCEKIDDSKFKNLVLCGQTGVGKTYLVECVCNKLLKKDKSIIFYSAFALNNLFLKFHTTFDESKQSLLDGVLDYELLIIDDLGSEPQIKKVNEDYLYLVLNERLQKNKSTIITTNLTLRQILDRYGDRTFSRICNKANTIIVNIENSDLRLKRQ